MIPSVSENPPDGTQHVPDGPAPTETQYVPDGPAPPLRLGDRPAALPQFGRFRALAEIGSGAMGTVFRAHDDVLGRPVAIKALHAGDASTRERFLREARAIGAVLHPNILAVYDAGTEQDTPYLVMELAAGGSLRERIRAGALPIEVVRGIGIQIARALAAAHAANILHRDVKPANILAAGDVWKLADFGIARLPDSTLTIEGQFLGSPSYAAPEALRAGQFSPASDIYSLGATLYEALAGVPPHGDHDMTSVVRKLEHDPPALHTRRPVPATLNAALMATLARDPAQRPTADELARLLAGSDDEQPVPRSVPRPPSRRTKAIALVLAAVAIVLVVVAMSRDKHDSMQNVPASLDPRAQFAKPPGPRDRPKPPGPRDRNEAPPPPREQQPQVVDQYGNPVDEETARKILEQMERDARDELGGMGPKRGKRKKKQDD
jgi:serine/threonine protein kinase